MLEGIPSGSRVFSSPRVVWPPARASLLGMSTVSIFCMGMALPATSTGRRRPYSSYLPSQTSSVFIFESGWGLSGPQRTGSVKAEGLPEGSDDGK